MSKKDKYTLLSIKNNAVLISQMDTIIRNVLRDNPLPVVYEDKIRIGNILIKRTKDMWTVYDTEKNLILGKTHYRKSALLVGKNHLKHKNTTTEILDLDRLIFKYNSDIEYYQNFIERTSDESVAAVRHARLCDCENKLAIANNKLLKFASFA